MNDKRIFLSAPDVREFERDYVMAAIDSNWIAPAGPDLAAFEDALAEWSGRSFAVALSSGTAALHLGLLQVGVKPGDDVLCSSLTFAGSAFPIIYCGANPVFIDSDLGTWNMNPDLLTATLHDMQSRGKLPAAAVVVDLYGICADYARIIPVLEEFGVPMIEDAAEALGSTYDGAKAGSFGPHALLSFNGNKIITSSGGGAFVTDDEEAAHRVRYLSTQARQPEVHYEHTEIGFNYRMSNICAALGRAQLETLPERISRRRELYERYEAAVSDIPGVDTIPVPKGTTSNHWLTCITIDPQVAPVSSGELIDAMETANIECRPVWKPMHMQPVFRQYESRLDGTSQALFETGVCLPSGSGMDDAALGRVLDGLLKLLR